MEKSMATNNKKNQERLLAILVIAILIFAVVYVWQNKASADRRVRTKNTLATRTCYNNGQPYTVNSLKINCQPDVVVIAPTDSTGKKGIYAYSAKVGDKIPISVNFWDDFGLKSVSLYETYTLLTSSNPGAATTATLNYTWDTAGKAPGTYYISAGAVDISNDRGARRLAITLQ